MKFRESKIEKSVSCFLEKISSRFDSFVFFVPSLSVERYRSERLFFEVIFWSKVSRISLSFFE